MDDADGAQLPDPQATAGDVLRSAREARGLTLDQIAERTRISRRQLDAIETGNYGSLPSPTYAVGFAKAYARVVGADEVAVAAQVRDEVQRYARPTPAYQPYEAPDPSRLPSRALAIVTAGIALAIAILAGLYFGTDLFRGGGRGVVASLPVPEPTAAPSAAPAPRPAAPVSGGQVTLTAAKTDVWMRVYDADNKTLYLGTLKKGDHFDVPQGANHPQINVGRADALSVTLNGKPAPALGTGEHAIKDVPVDAASIGARIAAAPAPSTPAPSPTSTPASTAAPTPTPSPSSTSRHADGDRPRDRHTASPRPRATDETARANMDAAAHPPAPGNSQ